MVNQNTNQMNKIVKNAKNAYEEFIKDNPKVNIKDPITNQEFSLHLSKGFYAESACMIPVLRAIYNFSKKTISNKDDYLPIFMQGETGVGKTQLAEIFHYNSDRKESVFLAKNCAAIPKEIFESEVFGSVSGAYTDAKKDKMGWLEIANGGTLFLDEIADLAIEHQAKLLTAFGERKEIGKGRASRVGSENEYEFDVRIVSATNKDLKFLVEKGQFRADLYYRLVGFSLIVPPLRDREKDIIKLSEAILEKINAKSPGKKLSFHSSFTEALKNYHFPGNIRALNTVIQRCAVHCDNNGEKEITIDAVWKTSREDWDKFGVDVKSDLVRFYEKFFAKLNYKYLSVHDLAVEIVSIYQDEDLINLFKSEKSLLKRLELIGHNHDIFIDNGTKELMAALSDKLNKVLDFKDVKKEDVLSYLESTNDLSIFKEEEIRKYRNSAVIRLYESGAPVKEIADSLDLTVQAIYNILPSREDKTVS